MKEALSNSESGWQGRSEKIQELEESLALLSRSDANDNDPSDAMLRGRVAEVERDRLSEYVGVLNQRLRKAEESSFNAERTLREERRKTAKLEQMLEKAHVVIRDADSGLSRLSGSQSSGQVRYSKLLTIHLQKC